MKNSMEKKTSSVRKPVNILSLAKKYRNNEKIVCITAYDASFASMIDEAGADLILVGDSVTSVLQGESLPHCATLEQMIYHAQCVQRGCQNVMIVGDLPFMTYQVSVEQAVCSSGRMVKEGRVGAVKLEGGGPRVAESVVAIIEAGIPVMGHIGLQPQAFHRMGGYRLQGKKGSVFSPKILLEEAQRLEEAGVFAIVLEGVVPEVANKITDAISIPTIGIGSGGGCSGQVLVMHDLLGITPEDKCPSFVKRYADIRSESMKAFKGFISDVKSGSFP